MARHGTLQNAVWHYCVRWGWVGFGLRYLNVPKYTQKCKHIHTNIHNLHKHTGNACCNIAWKEVWWESVAAPSCPMQNAKCEMQIAKFKVRNVLLQHCVKRGLVRVRAAPSCPTAFPPPFLLPQLQLHHCVTHAGCASQFLCNQCGKSIKSEKDLEGHIIPPASAAPLHYVSGHWIKEFKSFEK